MQFDRSGPSPRRKLRQEPLQPGAIKPRVDRLLPQPGRGPAAVERPDELGEAPRGDRPVPLGAEGPCCRQPPGTPVALAAAPARSGAGSDRKRARFWAAARPQAGSRSGRPESFRPEPAQAVSLLDDPLWTKLAKPKAAAQDALSDRVLPTTAKM